MLHIVTIYTILPFVYIIILAREKYYNKHLWFGSRRLLMQLEQCEPWWWTVTVHRWCCNREDTAGWETGRMKTRTMEADNASYCKWVNRNKVKPPAAEQRATVV